ncbi:MAG: hypothetical protein IPP35_02175 [Elusimicrobia bacterium]|nr:hypothetical protein [Elusimicrobiota bacterium]
MGNESLAKLGYAHPSPRLSSLVSLLSRHGTLHRIQRGPENSPLLVHVQDVHGQRKAQENLAALLADILEKYPETPVGLEGAEARDMDLSPFRGPSPEANAETGRFFFQTGYLTGAELPVFTSKTVPRYFGLEDPVLYLENVAAVKQSLPRQARWQQRLSAWTAILEKEKNMCFSPALKILDRKGSDREAGRTGLGEYADFLVHSGSSLKTERFPEVSRFVHLVQEEKGLDFARVEAERNQVLSELIKRLSKPEIQGLVNESVALRSGEIPYPQFYRRLRDLTARAGLRPADFPAFYGYVGYMVEADSLHPEVLLAELKQLEQRRWEEALQTASQQNIYQADQNLRRARALIGLNLTPEEWGEFVSLHETDVCLLPLRFGEDPSRWKADLKLFEGFYEKALARNKALAAAVKKKMAKGTKENEPVVFVAGGFHSNGLNSFLKGKATILTVSPKLDSVDGSAANDYLNVFTREKLPLDALFAAPKIALVDTPAVAPVGGSKTAVAVLARPVEAVVHEALMTGTVAIGGVRDVTITCSPVINELSDPAGTPALLSGTGTRTRIEIRKAKNSILKTLFLILKKIVRNPMFIRVAVSLSLVTTVLCFIPQGLPFLFVFGVGISPSGGARFPPFWIGFENLDGTVASVETAIKTLERLFPTIVPRANAHVRGRRNEPGYDILQIVNEFTHWPIQVALLLAELRCQLEEINTALTYTNRRGEGERLRRTSDLFGKTFFGVSSVLNQVEKLRVALSDPARADLAAVEGRRVFVENLGAVSEAGMKLSNSVVEEADGLFDASLKVPSILLGFVHFLAERTDGVHYSRMRTYQKYAYLFETGVWAAGAKRSPLNDFRNNLNPLFHQFYRQNVSREDRTAAVPEFGFDGFRLLLRLRGGPLYDELKALRVKIELEYKTIYPELLKVIRMIPDTETANYFLSVLDHNATGAEKTVEKEEFVMLVGGVWGKWFRAQGFGENPRPRFEDLRHFILLAPRVREAISIRLGELAEVSKLEASGGSRKKSPTGETTVSGPVEGVVPLPGPMKPLAVKDELDRFVGTNTPGVLTLMNLKTGIVEFVAATIRAVRHSQRFHWTFVEFGKSDPLLAAKALLDAVSGRLGPIPERTGWGTYTLPDVIVGREYAVLGIHWPEKGEAVVHPDLDLNVIKPSGPGIWEFVRWPGTQRKRTEAGYSGSIEVPPSTVTSFINQLNFARSTDLAGNPVYVVPFHGNTLAGFTYFPKGDKWKSEGGTFELASFVGRVPRQAGSKDAVPSMWFGFEVLLPRVPGFVSPSPGFFRRVRHVWITNEVEIPETNGFIFTPYDQGWGVVPAMPAIPKGSLVILMAVDSKNTLLKCIVTPDGQLYLMNLLEPPDLNSLKTALLSAGAQPVVSRFENKMITRVTYVWEGLALLQVKDSPLGLTPSSGPEITFLNARPLPHGDYLILTPDGPMRLKQKEPFPEPPIKHNERKKTGGAWFGNEPYKKWVSWFETPLSLWIGSMVAGAVAPFLSGLGLDPGAVEALLSGIFAAIVFWAPHRWFESLFGGRFGNPGSSADGFVFQLAGFTFLAGLVGSVPWAGPAAALALTLFHAFGNSENDPLDWVRRKGRDPFVESAVQSLGAALVPSLVIAGAASLGAALPLQILGGSLSAFLMFFPTHRYLMNLPGHQFHRRNRQDRLLRGFYLLGTVATISVLGFLPGRGFPPGLGLSETLLGLMGPSLLAWAAMAIAHFSNNVGWKRFGTVPASGSQDDHAERLRKTKEVKKEVGDLCQILSRSDGEAFRRASARQKKNTPLQAPVAENWMEEASFLALNLGSFLDGEIQKMEGPSAGSYDDALLFFLLESHLHRIETLEMSVLRYAPRRDERPDLSAILFLISSRGRILLDEIKDQVVARLNSNRDWAGRISGFINYAAMGARPAVEDRLSKYQTMGYLFQLLEWCLKEGPCPWGFDEGQFQTAWRDYLRTGGSPSSSREEMAPLTIHQYRLYLRLFDFKLKGMLEPLLLMHRERYLPAARWIEEELNRMEDVSTLRMMEKLILSQINLEEKTAEEMKILNLINGAWKRQDGFAEEDPSPVDLRLFLMLILKPSILRERVAFLEKRQQTKAEFEKLDPPISPASGLRETHLVLASQRAPAGKTIPWKVLKKILWRSPSNTLVMVWRNQAGLFVAAGKVSGVRSAQPPYQWVSIEFSELDPATAMLERISLMSSASHSHGAEVFLSREKQLTVGDGTEVLFIKIIQPSLDAAQGGRRRIGTRGNPHGRLWTPKEMIRLPCMP